MNFLSKKICFLGLAAAMLLSAFSAEAHANIIRRRTVSQADGEQRTYVLPPPQTQGTLSVEAALNNRRSHRNFQNKALSKAQLSQILWSAYGITMPLPQAGLRGGLRTTPSAGASFPLEIYVVIGNVEGVEPGVYRYIPQEHKIVRTLNADVRRELAAASLNQRMVQEAPITVVFTGIIERLTRRYGARSRRYMYMEIGHASQNVYLQAEALGLGTCAIGAFTDARVSAVLALPQEEEPLYLMPVGYIRR
ncbi:MAG: SagB/ThcOx family dehydrogenase [Elusimicrobia bacterium]|nr:SagB/ThcOx family dehydrogenase [Elusimicrobiota bacterium]